MQEWDVDRRIGSGGGDLGRGRHVQNNKAAAKREKERIRKPSTRRQRRRYAIQIALAMRHGDRPDSALPLSVFAVVFTSQ